MSYTIFNESGNFTVTGSTVISYIIVAGGGGGGQTVGTNAGGSGGGGGAGGVITGTTTLSADTYTVVIGSGGTAANGSSWRSANGGNSSFLGLTAIGGGAGAGTLAKNASYYPALSGGSGGGGESTEGSGYNSGGVGKSGQGNRGGDGYQGYVGTGYNRSGGGGGGATSNGATGGAAGIPAAGGTGIIWKCKTFGQGGVGGVYNSSSRYQTPPNIGKGGCGAATTQYAVDIAGSGSTGIVIIYTNVDEIPLSGGTIASGQTICYNANPAAFTSVADASGGTTGYTYQWQYATSSGGTWIDILGANSTTYDSGALTATRWFRRKVSDSNYCPEVAYSNTLEITVYPVLGGGIIASAQTICYNANPAAFTSVADASGASGSYVYQWQYVTGSTGGTWTDILGANATTYDSSNLTATRWFRRRVIDSGCPVQTGYSNTLEITVYPALYAGIIAASQSIFSGQTPALLTSTANASGASGSYVYQWQNSTNGVSYSNIGGATSATYQPPALTQTTYYKRRVYDTFCGIGGADYSNVVTITIVTTSGSYLYASTFESGNYIRIIDTSNLLTFTTISAGSGGIDGLLAYNGFIYFSNNAGLYKFNISTLSLVAQNTTADARSLHSFSCDGDYIYANGGYYAKKIRISDLSIVWISGSYGFNSYTSAVYGNYMYFNTSGGVYIYDKNTYVGVGGVITGIAGQCAIIVDDTYIYGTHNIHGYFSKYNKNTHSLVTRKLGTGLYYDIITDGNDLYCVGGHNVYKYDKDLNIIATSPILTTQNLVSIAISQDKKYIYAGGDLSVPYTPANQTIYKLNATDLSIVLSGENYGNLQTQEQVLKVEEFPAPTALPPPFCAGSHWTASGSTCGNSDGKITIVSNPLLISYFDVYDFTLTDVDGNSYTFNTTTGEATGLTSGYYFLTATVKPEYWYYYGRETCTFEWLEIEDSDTTMANTGVSVRNTICGGFGKQQGRIAYICTDSGANPVYTAKLYNKDTHDLIQTVTGNTIDLIIFVPLTVADYYCHITNSAGCSLLIGSTRVSGESLRSVAGIKRLWLTKWDASVEYDYWAQSDEDYYLASVDADFFNSIKIKRFVDSTLPDIWYSVNVQTKGITFQQSMNKTKQGFVFTDTLTLTIPEADNTKWKELVDILQHQYILIFLDNNGDYWCMGYRHGANVDGYKRENNEYILEFNAISENKILTNIDKQYVIDSIL